MGATGTTVPNEGQRTLKFLTDDGQGTSMKLQCGAMKNALEAWEAWRTPTTESSLGTRAA